MPKTATAKLTSEERCKKAFEKVMRSEFNPTVEHEGAGKGPMYSKQEWLMARWGWEACWNYLQTTVTKEFIES